METSEEELELAYQRARNFIGTVNLRLGSRNEATFYYAEYPKSIEPYSYTGIVASSYSFVCSAPAFANWKTRNTPPLVLASCAAIKPIDKEVSQTWWDFITDPIRSPWRKLIPESGFETIQDKSGNQIGFMLKKETLDKHTIHEVKSLVIAARAHQEFPNHMILWKQLVDHGVSPGDAMHLASYYAINMHTQSYMFSPVANFNHWCCDPTYFSPELFNNGEIQSQYGYMQSMFSTKESSSFNIDQAIMGVLTSLGTEQVSTFSRYHSITLEEIIQGNEKLCQVKSQLK